MAIHSWPSTDIMDLLPVQSASFMPHRQRQFSQAGGGTVYRAELAPSLWAATIKSVPLEHATAEQAKALIGSMEDQLATFYVWNPALAYPQSDSDGTGGVSSPTIASVNADNKRVTITGLPLSYVLTRGDYFVVTRASDSKRQLFQVVDASVTASGSPVTTPLFEVTPYIRTGMAAGDAVTLYKPGCEMVIMPGSLDISTVDASFSQVSFQTIEAP